MALCPGNDADHTVLRLQDEKTRRYVIRSYFGAADGKLPNDADRHRPQRHVEKMDPRPGNRPADRYRTGAR